MNPTIAQRTDFGYTKYQDGFNNCGDACENITYKAYDSAVVPDVPAHEMTDDLPDITNKAFDWLHNGYTLSP